MKSKPVILFFIAFLVLGLLILSKEYHIGTPIITPTLGEGINSYPTGTVKVIGTLESNSDEVKAFLDEEIDLDSFPIDGCITIHFNQPMDPNSSTLPIRMNPLVKGTYAWSDNFKTLTFLPNRKLDGFNQYRITISDHLNSGSDVKFADFPEWTLKVNPDAVPLQSCRNILENASLVISSTNVPENLFVREPKQYILPTSLSFNLKFSSPMDKQSVISALSVQPEVDLQYKWEDTTLIITLGEGVIPGQNYDFQLAGSASTLSGEKIKLKKWMYKTPPIVIDFTPDHSFSRLIRFNFTFNYEIIPDSMKDAFRVTPAFEFNTSWDETFKEFTITPIEPLKSDKVLEFQIGTEAQFAINKNYLEQAQTWSYLPPRFEISLDGSYVANSSSQIILTSNYPLDQESASKALQIEPSINHELSWSDDNKVLTITSLVPLPNLTTYTIQFIGEVLDYDGFPITDIGVYTYMTPSPIVNEPEIRVSWGTAIPINPEDPFKIIFDRPMEPTSTLSALTITPNVIGEYTWQDYKTLLIEPFTGHLNEYTEYSLSLEPSALDIDGNPILTTPYTWKVTTNGLPNIASFGEYGSGVQVVDMDGRRVIHITTLKDTKIIRFELYRVTLQDFIEFDTNTFQVPWVYERAHIPYNLDRASLQTSWEANVSFSDRTRRSDAVAEIYLPAGIPEGFYVLNLVTDHLDDQLLVVATRSTLAVKYSPQPNGGGPLLVWASNINDYVLRNLEIRVFDKNGSQITSGVTDEIGIFKTSLPSGSDPYLVIGRRDGEITIAGISGVWWTRGWDDDISDRTEVNNLYYTYIYTDRPIYRPGQTVNYKGIVRRDNDAVFHLPPSNFEAMLKLRDARNNLIFSRPVTLNQFGTFDGSFMIVDGSMLGDYALELVIGSETHRQTFQVQDYHKPDIHLTVTADKNEYISGETININVDTQYLFGEPVSNANLHIVQYQLLPRTFCWYCDDVTDEFTWFDALSNPVNLVTDENGHATYAIKAELASAADNYTRASASTTWGLEVTVDDGSNQIVSAFTTFSVYQNTANIELELGGWLYEPNKPIPIVARFSSNFDEAVNNQVLHLEVEERTSRWDFERYQTHVITTREDGLAFINLILEDGIYNLILTSKDSRGHQLKYERYVYVRDFTSTWLLDYTTDLTLVVEDRDYTPGERAEIIIESSFSGEGLLTIERGSVIEQRMIKIEAPFTTITVPIQPEFAPNVYVLVQAWEPQNTDISQSDYAYESIPDSLLRWDAVELSVPDSVHELQVDIESDVEIYSPRQDATFTLHVSDAQGNPVQSEVSLALVDESIFLLADDPAGEIHSAFYKRRKLGVYYYDSLSPWRYLRMPERGGGGGEGWALGNPRMDFPDAVLWIPTLETDQNGEATITVTLPDTLTSWRVTAKAVTKDTLIGQGETKIITQQPLVIRPLPPLNLTQGDNFVLSAKVHNFSSEMMDLTVSLNVIGIKLVDGTPVAISLGPGEDRIISWAAIANTFGESSFIISARSTQGDTDAVQMSFPVQRLAIPVIEVHSGQFQNEINLAVTLVENALPESHVLVKVDATLAASIFNGLEYLTGYPYGCVEQTMSRALPNAVVARAFQNLGFAEKINNIDLDTKIEASIQRLYAFQHDDGGWGWWYDDPSTSYQTAWVVFGLATTANSGYQMDPSVIERGVTFLKEHLDEMNPATRAYSIYAMTIAGYGELELALQQVDNLNTLDPFSQAALALTFHSLGAADIAQMILDKLLSEMVVESDGGIHSQGSDYDGYFNRKFMSSDIRSTAIILQALITIQPDHRFREGIVKWLQDQRSTYGWGSTNETAFSILALTDYLLVQQSETENSVVSININGKLFYSEKLTAGKFSVETMIPVDMLSSGINNFRINSDSGVILYYNLSNQMFVEQESIESAGIDITRAYLDPITKEPASEIQEGDLVLVQLKVRIPSDSFYIILEDHLPGGLEALNEALNTTSHDVLAADRARSGYSDWNLFLYNKYGYNNKEIWSDRVIFFITELSKGMHIFEYYTRATVAGEFTALPVELGAMYDPTIWGRSASSIIIVGENPGFR